MKISDLTLFLVLILAASCKSKTNIPLSEVKVGVAKEYYSDGTLKSETDSKDGKANGLSKNYNKDGVLESVYTFKDAVRQGPGVSYYPTGEVKLKMFYTNGKREGKTLWYYKTGELFRETSYKNGKIEGIVKSYYPNGKIMAEAQYLHEFPGTGLKEYDEKGVLIRDETQIVIKELNTKPINGMIVLELYLNPSRPGTTFFTGNLTDGKYLNETLSPLPFEIGKSRYNLVVPGDNSQPEPLKFVASFQTDKSNYRIITKTYRLPPEIR
jgi:hypothetical protein